MPMLEQQVRRAPDAVGAKGTLTLVRDGALGRAFGNGVNLGPGQIDHGPDGSPVFSHTYPSINGGIVLGSNGTRAGDRKDILVAEPMVSPAALLPSTEAQIAKLFGPPLKPLPFSVRQKPTPAGLAVAEVDRNSIVRHTVGHAAYVARPQPLEEGNTILVATAAPDAEVRHHEDIAVPITRRRELTPYEERAWQRKNIQERRYSLTSLDARIDNATAYMDDMNAIREPNDRPTTVSQREAINHVLHSLTAPEPADEALANQRLAAGVPANVNPETVYRRFTHQLHAVHSEITGVTYTHTKETIKKISRWVNKQLKDGANPLSTYYEAAQRTIQSQMQARAEMQRGERVTVDQMIEDAARASQPTPELVFPPLPDVSFFSPHMQEQAGENLAHFAHERESAKIVYQRHAVSSGPRLEAQAPLSLMEHSRQRK